MEYYYGVKASFCAVMMFLDNENLQKNTINETSCIKHGFLFLSTFALFILEGILIF